MMLIPGRKRRESKKQHVIDQKSFFIKSWAGFNEATPIFHEHIQDKIIKLHVASSEQLSAKYFQYL